MTDRLGHRRAHDGNIRFRERRHALLAGQRLLDVGRQLLGLAPLALGGMDRELRQHLARQHLQRLADVLVPVPAGLLQQDDLVDAGRLEGGACARKSSAVPMPREPWNALARLSRPRRVGVEHGAVALLAELLEQLGAPRHAIVGDQRGDGEAEELEAFLARRAASARSSCSEKADTMAMLALTLWPSGTQASLLMMS